MLQRMLMFTNRNNVLSEEINSLSMSLLGNYPQGLSAFSLISAIVKLEQVQNPNAVVAASSDKSLFHTLTTESTAIERARLVDRPFQVWRQMSKSAGSTSP